MPYRSKEYAPLLASYVEAVRAYRKAVDTLARERDQEFLRAFEDAERLREVAQDFRLKLDALGPKKIKPETRVVASGA